ncbi:hypothetical protein CSKR_102871 [Clonorchis sinensis]|uniref:Beclin 1-associated autophagy-related key regulator n=1 Tax=Clonorchis sinensis TaxID=79923 RepID=A0A8T1MSG1_CLOSI|nr:hypothetical protein CSKR_102871 [Clonorchis sinensis]
MSAQDREAQSADEDYQIIDASCFQVDTQEQGLEFHSNLPCPICTSFQSNFICEKCIKCGSFTHSRGAVSGNCYSDLGNRLFSVNQKIRTLSEQLHQRHNRPKSTPLEELKILAASLKNAISFHTKENQNKRRNLEKLQQRLLRCQTDSQELLKRRAAVLNFLNSLGRRRLKSLKDLETHNERIERIRASYLRELLHSHLVVDLSPDVGSPDTFSGSGLHLDRENIFIGPEPLLSSHTVLTYCIPAIRAAALFTDLWIPPSIQQHLQLDGSFLTGLPQRDDLGRVYSAVLHAVHMLCSCRRVDVRSVLERAGRTLPPNHSVFNPLLGLFCLARFTQPRQFDAPYKNALDGFFGKVEPPASFVSSRSLRLRLEHVEPGEEAKELEESSSCEVSQTTEVQSQCTQQLDDTAPTGSAGWSTGNELDRWELIANEPNQRDSS